MREKVDHRSRRAEQSKAVYNIYTHTELWHSNCASSASTKPVHPCTWAFSFLSTLEPPTFLHDPSQSYCLHFAPGFRPSFFTFPRSSPPFCLVSLSQLSLQFSNHISVAAHLPHYTHELPTAPAAGADDSLVTTLLCRHLCKFGYVFAMHSCIYIHSGCPLLSQQTYISLKSCELANLPAGFSCQQRKQVLCFAHTSKST